MPHMTFVRTALVIALSVSLSAQSSSSRDPVAVRIDPYVEKPRIVVMTDIANEADDQMSMVRFLVYSNLYDVEGLIASTSTWIRNKVRPDVINSRYALVPRPHQQRARQLHESDLRRLGRTLGVAAVLR